MSTYITVIIDHNDGSEPQSISLGRAGTWELLFRGIESMDQEFLDRVLWRRDDMYGDDYDPTCWINHPDAPEDYLWKTYFAGSPAKNEPIDKAFFVMVLMELRKNLHTPRWEGGFKREYYKQAPMDYHVEDMEHIINTIMAALSITEAPGTVGWYYH